MKSKRRNPVKTGFDLVEEATHVLRSAPTSTLATYYSGAIPFALAFLYFWADMSRNPFAIQHVAEASLVTAVMFLWMKLCHALFAARIRAQLSAEEPPRWTWIQSLRVFLVQAVIQPSGLFLLPLALIIAMPFAWVYAFYQNVTVLADPESIDISASLKKAWKHAALWSWQNHLALGIVMLLGLFVFLNFGIVAFAAPTVLKTILAIETVFSRNPMAMFNTTFFAVICTLTYLAVDPIVKVFYALRCFYGESLQSGEDLKAELRRSSRVPQLAAAILVIILSSSLWTAAQAKQISPSELDHRIDGVIHESKYTWRMPREAVKDEKAEKGAITRFLERAARFVADKAGSIVNWVEDALRKIFTPRSQNRTFGSGYTTSTLLLYALLAAVLSILLVTVLRLWRQRAEPFAVHLAQGFQPPPDVADENVGADQLPEDGWTKLARELLERGELRLAMRALYLASLANLAGRNLIGIARYKSNRDYEIELMRRGHAMPTMLSAFQENLLLFERIWYGMHEVDRDMVDQFAANVHQLRSSA